MKFGPDGALYTLEWGGGFGRDNPNSGIYRVDYINGSRSPIARGHGDARQRPGAADRHVRRHRLARPRGRRAHLRVGLRRQRDGRRDRRRPRRSQYKTPGAYSARLTVTDPAGKSGTTVIPVTVGNTRPQVSFNGPVNGGFIDWGDEVAWDVTVTDADGGVDDRRTSSSSPRWATTRTRTRRSPVPGRRGSRRHRPRRRPLGGHEGVLRARRPLHGRRRRRRAAADRLEHGRAPAQAQGGRARRQIAGTESRRDQRRPRGRRRRRPARAQRRRLGGLRARSTSPASTRSRSASPRRRPAAASSCARTRRPATVLGTGVGPEHRRRARAGRRHGRRSRRARDDGAVRRRSPATPTSGSTSGRPTARACRRRRGPTGAITSPTDMQARRARHEHADRDGDRRENDVTGSSSSSTATKVGDDATAPYSVEWTQTEEDYYVVHAVATNERRAARARRARSASPSASSASARRGRRSATPSPRRRSTSSVTTSRSAPPAPTCGRRTQPVRRRVPARRRRPRTSRRSSRSASFDGTHNASKAGIMVRNDISQANGSPGYMVFAEKGNGETEFMHDAAGNGQVNNDGEPVATGCGTGSQPSWLKVQKKNKVFTVWCSRDGTTWTQVGTPTAIPSAAAAQDIGLFVVSHIAGTLATAEFSDWSLTEIDGGPGSDPRTRRRRARRSSPTSSTARRSTPRAGRPSAARPRGRRRGVAADHQRRHRRPQHRARSATSARPRRRATGRRRRRSRSRRTTSGSTPACSCTSTTTTTRRWRSRSTRTTRGSSSSGRRPAAAGPRTATTCTVPAAYRDDGVRAPRRRAARSCTASYSPDGTAWTDHRDRRRSRPGPRSARSRRVTSTPRTQTAAFDWFRITPDEAAGGSRLRRRVRRRRARRLPLGQDQGLEVEQPRRSPTASSPSRRSTPTSAARATARSRTSSSRPRPRATGRSRRR